MAVGAHVNPIRLPSSQVRQPLRNKHARKLRTIKLLKVFMHRPHLPARGNRSELHFHRDQRFDRAGVMSLKHGLHYTESVSGAAP